MLHGLCMASWHLKMWSWCFLAGALMAEMCKGIQIQFCDMIKPLNLLPNITGNEYWFKVKLWSKATKIPMSHLWVWAKTAFRTVRTHRHQEEKEDTVDVSCFPWILPSGDIWQCLRTFFIVTLGGLLRRQVLLPASSAFIAGGAANCRSVCRIAPDHT